MKTIKRRPFGNTGLDVTEISLGAMNLRLGENAQAGRDLVNYTLDKGINLIDTARAYNGITKDGKPLESEVIVGEVVSKRTDLSEPIIIVTKGHGYNPGEFDTDLAISREKLGVIKGSEGKILLGQTEIKLVYFFHGLTQERWDEMSSSGVLDHAKKRQKEGLFTFLGFSSHPGHEKSINEAIDSGYFEVCELPYNVFAPTFCDENGAYGNFFRKIHERGIALINMKAFAGNGMVAKTELFKDYCNITPANRLLFCLSNSYFSTVDAGCRFIEELDEDILVSSLPHLDIAQQNSLKEEAAKVAQLTDNTCRECTHCLEKFECPQGINFPQILALSARFKLASGFGLPTEAIQAAYNGLSLKGDVCIACGDCSPWCEYKLDIPILMKDAHNLLS